MNVLKLDWPPLVLYKCIRQCHNKASIKMGFPFLWALYPKRKEGRGKPMSLWESMFTSVESKECFVSWCPIHSMGSRSQEEAKQVRSEILHETWQLCFAQSSFKEYLPFNMLCLQQAAINQWVLQESIFNYLKKSHNDLTIHSWRRNTIPKLFSIVWFAYTRQRSLMLLPTWPSFSWWMFLVHECYDSNTHVILYMH